MGMIDISKKLSNEKPILKIAEGKEYNVNNSKNTMLLIDQQMRSGENEVESMDYVIRLTLGEKAFKEIESMEMPFSDYKILFIGVMAAVSGQTYDEVEKNFNTPS